MMKNISIFIIMLLSFSANCELKFKANDPVDLPQSAKHITYDEEGNIQELAISTWNDRVKTKNGREYLKFEQGYSYEKKQGYLKVFDQKDNLIEETWNKAFSGGVSKEEVLIAFDIFKKDPEIKSLLKDVTDEIHIFGGFNFTDDKACKPENRCLNVLANTDSNSLVAHSVISLTESKVVFPVHDNMKKQMVKNNNKKITSKKID